MHSVNAAGTESSLQHPDLLISNFLHHTQHCVTVSQVGSRHGKKLSSNHTGPRWPEEQERLWEKESYWPIIEAGNEVFGEQLQGRLVEAVSFQTLVHPILILSLVSVYLVCAIQMLSFCQKLRNEEGFGQEK